MGRRRRRSRGAAAVEAALIVPLLVFTTFGMLEFGLYWQQNHTFNDAARSAARLGATMAREPNYHTEMVGELADVVGTLSNQAVETITIYKASPVTGDPITGTPDTCTIDCYRFNWNPASKTFVQVVGPEWPPLEMSACGEEGSTDYIGVWIKGTYDSVTGLIGDRTVTETTVLRLEPVPLSTTCEP
jgi:hypothetical protein